MAATLLLGVWDLGTPLDTVDESILLVYPEQLLSWPDPGH